MSESISAFDGNYVRLGQVAALLAQAPRHRRARHALWAGRSLLLLMIW